VLEAGKKLGIQQIWDFCHFDLPDEINPLEDIFIERFVKYALYIHSLLRNYIKGTLYISLINEISFFSWIGADRGVWAPFLKGQRNGFLMKSQLVRAVIEATKKIKQYDNDTKFIAIDPFMRREPVGKFDAIVKRFCSYFNSHTRFEAWDMIFGYKHAHLGGNPTLVDYIGVNYYQHNQEWVKHNNNAKLVYDMMDWNSTDRQSLVDFLEPVYTRYNKPIIITETGSYGKYRKRWWTRLNEEVHELNNAGKEIIGVCAYPILDRPHSIGYLEEKSGLWDFDSQLHRIAYKPGIELLMRLNQTASS
jgi:beta-glucosidase/6-phospho-beta-glucosidase/beta-galactosidase